MAEKFRSIKAFQEFEGASKARQRLLEGGLPTETPDEPSTLRVLARVKEQPAGVRRKQLADDLGVPVSLLERPLLRLVTEGLVKLRVGATPDEDVIEA